MGKPYYYAENYRAKTAISYLVRRAHNLIMPRVETLFAENDLTFTQWAVLMYLRDGMGESCADIARDMHHDSGALTRILDQLEERGLVERQRSGVDRRVVKLSLTKDGMTMVESLIPLVAGYLNDLMGDFNKAEADQLISLMTRLVARAEQVNEAKP
ncbi:MarR family transcriptional regulator [Parvibaculum sp.]|uniref:MarR family winged helix-turn-helix transcriptional regulator n=1 Tax=Parvibaculum sp. TaxID=2024848 RepID=UPI00320D2173